MKEVKEVVHVPTYELAEKVLRVAKENCLWNFESTLSDMVMTHGSNLCIDLKKIGYGNILDLRNIECKIITAEEFLNRYKDSELDRLRKENAELKQQLKAIEDQPKVGDVCLFWDEDMNSYLVSVLKNVKLGTEYPYENENGLHYANCIKATDENIKAKIKELTNK